MEASPNSHLYRLSLSYIIEKLIGDTMDLRVEAERIADAKIKFEENLYKYLIVNSIIAVICFVFLQSFSLLFFVMFFWGISVLNDFFKAYPFGEMVAPNYREKMVEKELSKMGE